MKIYMVEELRTFPVGTEFIHSTLGKCVVNSRGYMEFIDNKELVPAPFGANNYPWNLPMRKLDE